MKKSFGAKPWVYPVPVFIVATYNEDGSVDAMNAAWGGINDTTQVALCLSHTHKTVKNILAKKAFTVSIADEAHVVEADYLGVVSANKVADKFAKSGLHATKSELVDAPIIDEFPMVLECKLVSYDEKTDHLVGEIVNVSADEHVLTDGKIDPSKLKPITFDPVNHVYLKLGEKVGNAFADGKKLWLYNKCWGLRENSQALTFIFFAKK